MTRYLRATVTLPTAPADAPLPLHGRRRGRRLRQRHPGDRHQGAARQRRERVAEGAARRRHQPAARRRQHDRRAGQEPPQPERRPDARRLHRPPEGRRAPRSTPAAPGSRPRPARPAGSSPASTTPPGRRARELATYGSGPWGSQRLPPAAAQPRTCARTSRRPSPSPRARLLRHRARPVRGPHQRRQGRRRACSRRAGPTTTSASSPQTYDVTEPRPAGRQRDRRRARRRLVRRPPRRAASKWGTQPALLAQLKHHLHRRHPARASPPTTPGRPAAAACSSTTSTTARPTTPASTSPAGTSPASTTPAGRSAVERTETDARSSPSPGAADHGAADARSRSRHPAEPGICDLRPRPELRRLGPAAGPRRRPARRSRCATARCSTPTARSTPPTCARAAAHRHASRCAAPAPTETYEPRFTVPRLPLRRGHRLPGHADARQLDRAAWSAPTCADYGTFTHAPTRWSTRSSSTILWGQRSNLLAVPTDCPQRDERLGWTGDIAGLRADRRRSTSTPTRLPRPSAADDLRDAQTRRRRLHRRRAGRLLRRGHGGLGRRRRDRARTTLWQRYGDPRVVTGQLRRDDAAGSTTCRRNGDRPDPPNQGVRRLAQRRRQHRRRPDRHGVLRPLGADIVARMAAARSATTPTPPRYAHARPARSRPRSRPARARRRHGRRRQPDRLRARADVRPACPTNRCRRPRTSSSAKVGRPRRPPDDRASSARRTCCRCCSRHGHARRRLPDPAAAGLSRLGLHDRPRRRRRSGSAGTASGPTARSRTPGMNSFNHYGLGSVGDWLYDAVGGLAPATPRLPAACSSSPRRARS